MRHPAWTWLEGLIVAILVGLMAYIAMSVRAGASELDEYAREDRVLHLGGGFAIGATTYALVQAVVPDLRPWVRHAVAIGVSALAGIAKEWCDDEGRGDCDARDAIATTAGGVLGSFSVSLVFRF